MVEPSAEYETAAQGRGFLLSMFATEYVCHRLYERKTCSRAA
jgi:hypothetical protein